MYNTVNESPGKGIYKIIAWVIIKRRIINLIQRRD